MYEYRIVVSDQECKKYSNTDKLVSDGIDFCQIAFILSEEWKDLDCVAQFKQNDKCYSIALIDNKCKLPNEIQEGTVSIGIFGYKSGEVVRGTSIYLTDNVEKSGFCSDGEFPIPPTPDLYSQLIAKVEAASKAAYPKGGTEGQVLTKLSDEEGDFDWKTPQDGGTGGGYNIGSGLKLDKQSNTLSVDTANNVEQDNTRPITSAAVYTTVGNIEVLLGTI